MLPVCRRKCRAVPARKTESAHRALATHGAALDLRQRRVLILCDGRRTASELVAMLGADTVAVLQQLQDAGYLDDVDAPRAVPASPLAAVESTGATTAPSQATTARRRSLSAARIYVQGMLELQRAPAAQALRARLVGSIDEDATVTAILDAIAGLPAFTKPGYAARVRERVAEVMPESHLPALAGLVLDRETDAVA
ncbi:hypothetical protein AO715_05945 [Xanthomonas sp. Mitacek01]|nr:hypothetical protein AO715_05945 [Xanthomonas sp. Mitacek01]